MVLSVDRINLIMHLRKRGIHNTEVLRTMELVPRDMFVDSAFGEVAYDDTALPISCGQTISQPFVVAYMTELLEPDVRMTVLEVGTGSGYQAAILSHLFRRVYTIERHRPLREQAEARFRALGLSNITAIIGDGSRGWPKAAPYDRIIVTAAARSVPRLLVRQLTDTGRMILPLGARPDDQYLVQIDMVDGEPEQTRLLPVRFVPLVRGKVDA